MTTPFDNWYDLSWHPFMGFFPQGADLVKPKTIVCFEDPWLPNGPCPPEAFMNVAEIFYQHTWITFTERPDLMQPWVENYYKTRQPRPVKVSPKETLTGEFPLKNLCIGVHLIGEDGSAGARLRYLKTTPACMRALNYRLTYPLDLHRTDAARLVDEMGRRVGEVDVIAENWLDFALVFGDTKNHARVSWIAKVLRQLGEGYTKDGKPVIGYKHPACFVQNLPHILLNDEGTRYPVRQAQGGRGYDPYDMSTWPPVCQVRERLKRPSFVGETFP